MFGQPTSPVSRDQLIISPQYLALSDYFTRKFPTIGRWKPSESDTLYHYTDAGGLLGMMQENRLWATDMRFLNDPSEVHYFWENFYSIIKARCAETGSSHGETLLRLLNPPRMRKLDDVTPYCVSFTMNGDLLSQWRGYGAFGHGYSVGFQFSQNVPHPQIATLYRVSYDQSELKSVIEEIFDVLVASIADGKAHYISQWWFFLDELSLIFKEPAYSEENEVRIIFRRRESDELNHLVEREGPLKFRSRSSDIVPYVPIALDWVQQDGKAKCLPISRIIMGPGVKPENEYSLRAALDQFGYKKVDVRPSAVKFRVG